MRNVTVRVKPSSRTPSIESRDGELVVAVREPAQEGRANDAVRRALAAHFDVAISRVRLVRGATGRIKTYRIDDRR